MQFALYIYTAAQ